MRWVARLLAACVVLAAGMGSAQAPPKRFALVIGNAAYRTAGWQLTNPVNDARLVADQLKALGFEVTPVMNATRDQMIEAMRVFGAQLANGDPETVGFFYYAGHGVEQDGANLLVPVDVTARTMDELRFQAPPMQFLLRDMGRAGNKVNIVVLDACRNLPLPSGYRDGPAGGLAEISDLPDVLIAYATRAGISAPDNPAESNSVFSRVLADALRDYPTEPIGTLFSSVQADVFKATGYQRPEYHDGLLRAPRFRLREPPPQQVSMSAPPAEAPKVAPNAPTAAGAVFKDCDACPEMVVIPAGQFVMGASERVGDQFNQDGERPQHQVTIAQPFALARTEVTFAQYNACALEGACLDVSGEGPNMPVSRVTYRDAVRYVGWLNAKVGGQNYRLPSEAEWEYAARGRVNGQANDTPYPWGRSASRDHANYKGVGGPDTWDGPAPVAQFLANPFGLYDMHGNVEEAVEDCFSHGYAGAPNNGGVRPDAGGCKSRIVRGGTYYGEAAAIRSARRSISSEGDRHQWLGFRVARTITNAPAAQP